MEDLSHTLSPEFPTFGGKPMNSLKRTTTLKKDGFNTFTWNLFEHIGTHIDAPVHFSENGVTVDQIPASRLVAPLAVIDVPARASENSDTTVTVDDLLKWESTHGRLPEKRVVAMQSGWSEFSPTQRFRNADPKGGIHFPGFHAEAARFLIEERSVIGIAVDTLSLDPGNSKDFAVHANWLSSGRWGIECLANLQALPAHGATIVVGAPKIAGATGGPSRVFAFVP
jgi:kynurenine formamidase